MPTLFIPPQQTFEALLSKPGGSALAIKKATNTTLDIKTIKRVFAGTASPASADALLQDIVAAFPAALSGTKDFAAFVERTYPGNENRYERDIVLSHLSWQSVVYAVTNTSSDPHNFDSDWVAKTTSLLVALDKASVRATVLANTGRFEEAIDLTRTTEIARFLPGHCWGLIESTNTLQEFAYATTPLRMIGALFILAVAEVLAYPDTDTSRFERCLPAEERGNNSFPFARCIAALQSVLNIRTSEEFADKLLLDAAKGATDHQRRNLRRWRRGTVPEQPAFGAMMHRAKRLMGAETLDPKEELPLYFGLRYMHALGRGPIKPFFGSKKEFFDIYPALFALAKGGGV